MRSRIRESIETYIETFGFDDVTGGDDGEHEPELEAFNDIRASELEQILLLELLEDGGFDLDKLV